MQKKAGKILQHNLHIIEAFEKFKAEKQRLKNECIEREKEQAFNSSVTASNDFFVFDPSLPPLFDVEIEALLIGVDISGGMSITFQGS